mmetsp:Transcript_63436/g.159990  ORF Transcript_63436/g.159990 Transcript_63436/m.159990 type:complete len:236 (-) Transcript_63436:557-1264(-)
MEEGFEPGRSKPCVVASASEAPAAGRLPAPAGRGARGTGGRFSGRGGGCLGRVGAGMRRRAQTNRRPGPDGRNGATGVRGDLPEPGAFAPIATGSFVPSVACSWQGAAMIEGAIGAPTIVSAGTSSASPLSISPLARSSRVSSAFSETLSSEGAKLSATGGSWLGNCVAEVSVVSTDELATSRVGRASSCCRASSVTCTSIASSSPSSIIRAVTISCAASTALKTNGIRSCCAIN